MNLPGIKKLSIVSCSDLPGNLLERANSGLPIGLMNPITDIDFVGTAKLEVNGVSLHNSLYEKAQLTFNAYKREYFPFGTAFVIEDVEGATWLIGLHERPYPVVEFTDTIGFPGEAKIVEYVVTFVAEKALLKVG